MSLSKGKDQQEFIAALLKSRGSVVFMSDEEYETAEALISRRWDLLMSERLVPVAPSKISSNQPKFIRTELGVGWNSLVRTLGLEDRIIDCVIRELVPRCPACGERAQAPTSLDSLFLPPSGFLVVAIQDENSDLPLKERCEFYGSERAIVDNMLVRADILEGSEGEPVLSIAAVSESARLQEEVARWFSRGGKELRLYHFISRQEIGREVGRLSDAWWCSTCEVAVRRPTRLELADMPECGVCRGDGWIAVNDGRYHACRDCDGFGSVSEFRRSDFHGIELQHVLKLSCAEFLNICKEREAADTHELSNLFEEICAAGFGDFPLGTSVDWMSIGERTLLTILVGHLSKMFDVSFVVNGGVFNVVSLRDMPRALLDQAVVVAASSGSNLSNAVDAELSEIDGTKDGRSKQPEAYGVCDIASSAENTSEEKRSLMPSAILRDIRRGPLRAQELHIPLGSVTAIQGPIGSGKSLLLQVISERFSKRRKLERQNSFGRLKRVNFLGGLAGRGQVVLDLLDIATEFVDEIARLRVAKEAGLLSKELSLDNARYRCAECGGLGRTSDGALCSVCEGALYDWQVSELSMHGRTVGELLKAPLDELVGVPWASERIVGVLQALSKVELSGLSLSKPISDLTPSVRSFLSILAGLAALNSGIPERQKGKKALEGDLILIDGPGCAIRPHQERIRDLSAKLCEAGATIVYATLPEALESMCASVVHLIPSTEPVEARAREVFFDTRFARVSRVTSE